MKTNEEFFDSVSSFYDKMINFDTAVARRKEALQNFIEEGMFSAADVGSGTGLDSISLSLLGLNVTGFDISRSMIERAELNSRLYNTSINFVKSPADQLPEEYSGKFDIAFSLGNTIANVNRNKITDAFKSIYKILKPNGRLVIQILNFDNIMLHKDRIVNITEKEYWYYIRFYDFLDEEINFNILKFRKDNPSERQLDTTILYRYSLEELKKLMIDAGFKNITFYANLVRKEFDPVDSKDMVITAEK
jgi:glycine/sarcosine N-methyltransferase